MNNHSSGRAPRRVSETTSILTQQILGLITRDGQGTFVETEKMHRLDTACKKAVAGNVLTDDEQALLVEYLSATAG